MSPSAFPPSGFSPTAGPRLLALRAGLEAAFEALELSVLVVTPALDVCFANRACRAALADLEPSLLETKNLSAFQLLTGTLGQFSDALADFAQRGPRPTQSAHRTEVVWGSVTLEAQISPLRDPVGEALGWLVTWEDCSAARQHRARLDAVVSSLSTTGRELTDGAEGLLDLGLKASLAADDTHDRARTVASAAEDVSGRMQEVASATVGMTKTANDISKSTAKAASLASQAVGAAEESSGILLRLTRGSEEIGEVTDLIGSIAEQTNLLALNAAIQASRTGGTGRGFAVVASEMKTLARDTAAATRTVATLVANLHRDMASSTQATQRVCTTIGEIDALQASIAEAVERQTAATGSIEHNLSVAAQGTTGIVDAAQRMSAAASASKGSIASSVSSSVVLFDKVGGLLDEFRAILAVGAHPD